MTSTPRTADADPDPSAPLPGVVTVFSKTGCSYCVKAKELLARRANVRVGVVELDLASCEDEFLELRDTLRELTRGEARTVPQIFVNDEYWPGGYARLHALEAEGRLDDALREALLRPPRGPIPFELCVRIRDRYRDGA